MFWFFGHEACETLATQPEMVPSGLALEGVGPNNRITREVS